MSPYEVPATLSVEAHATSSVEVPTTSCAEAPIMSSAEISAESPVEAPITSSAKAPVASSAEAPITSSAKVPAMSPAHVPTSSVEALVTSPAESSASSPVGGPAPSSAEVPATSPVEGPATSSVETPVITLTEAPTTSFADDPASPSTRVLVSPTNTPAASFAEASITYSAEGLAKASATGFLGYYAEACAKSPDEIPTTTPNGSSWMRSITQAPAQSPKVEVIKPPMILTVAESEGDIRSKVLAGTYYKPSEEDNRIASIVSNFSDKPFKFDTKEHLRAQVNKHRLGERCDWPGTQYIRTLKPGTLEVGPWKVYDKPYENRDGQLPIGRISRLKIVPDKNHYGWVLMLTGGLLPYIWVKRDGKEFVNGYAQYVAWKGGNKWTSDPLIYVAQADITAGQANRSGRKPLREQRAVVPPAPAVNDVEGPAKAGEQGQGEVALAAEAETTRTPSSRSGRPPRTRKRPAHLLDDLESAVAKAKRPKRSAMPIQKPTPAPVAEPETAPAQVPEPAGAAQELVAKEPEPKPEPAPKPASMAHPMTTRTAKKRAAEATEAEAGPTKRPKRAGQKAKGPTAAANPKKRSAGQAEAEAAQGEEEEGRPATEAASLSAPALKRCKATPAPKPEVKPELRAAEEEAQQPTGWHDRNPAYMKHAQGQPLGLARKALAGAPVRAAAPCYHCVVGGFECLRSGPESGKCIHCIAMMRKVVDCKPLPAGLSLTSKEEKGAEDTPRQDGGVNGSRPGSEVALSGGGAMSHVQVGPAVPGGTLGPGAKGAKKTRGRPAKRG